MRAWRAKTEETQSAKTAAAVRTSRSLPGKKLSSLGFEAIHVNERPFIDGMKLTLTSSAYQVVGKQL